MTELARMKCVACRGGVPTLTEAELAALQPEVPGWQVIEVDGVKRLERTFKLKNFIEAVAFTNKVAMLAEKEDHHPLIVTEWGKVKVQWWTHKIKGLHKNDFIMAAKVDALEQVSGEVTVTSKVAVTVTNRERGAEHSIGRGGDSPTP